MRRPARRPNTTRLVVSSTVTACLLVTSACGSDDDADDPASLGTGAEPAVTTTSAIAPSTTTATTAAATESTEATVTTEATGAPTTTPDTSMPDTSAPAEGASTEPALCEPYLQVSAAFAGEPDPATIGGLLDEVDAAAPADLAEQLAVLTEGGRTVLETGDSSVFESPDFDAAVTAADSWVFENCAFVTTTEIVATEYQYEGQADTYPTGRTAFAVVNEGVEAHELAILRKNDGVDLTLDELLELPEAEAEQMVTYVGATFVGPPGARSNLVVDLEPGNYLAVCNVPAGTMVAEDGSFVEGTGQPHVMLGMSFEFAVE